MTKGSTLETAGTALADITGVVLAGGQSSRMGRDKATIALEQGESEDFLSRTAALLAVFCQQVLIAGRAHPDYAYCLDEVPGQGPMGGIATALASSGRACLVLSCDLPFMEPTVLERLVAHRARRFAGALATLYRQKDTGHTESLVAVYEYAALPCFQACLRDNKLQVSRAIPLSLQHFLDYAPEEAQPFFNVNTPEDLLVARKLLPPVR